jgi:hypothetical protein
MLLVLFALETACPPLILVIMHRVQVTPQSSVLVARARAHIDRKERAVVAVSARPGCNGGHDVTWSRHGPARWVSTRAPLVSTSKSI